MENRICRIARLEALKVDLERDRLHAKYNDDVARVAEIDKELEAVESELKELDSY